MRLARNLFADNHRSTFEFAAFMRAMGIPGDTLVELDNALQERFFPKDAETGQGKERWNLGNLQTPCPLEEFHGHLRKCGFMDETQPQRRHYDYAAWPGALVVRAAVRLQDLIKAWESGVRWRETIVFGGKRPLQAEKENYEACCRALGIEPQFYGGDFDREDDVLREVLDPSLYLWHRMQPKTELDMMRWLWEIAKMPADMREKRTIFVDAPMKPPVTEDGQPIRPNTEDTINAWLETDPAPGSLLLSSGAPYGMAQSVAFEKVLLKKFRQKTDVATFGHAAPNLDPAQFMREVAGTVHAHRIACGK